MKTNSNFIFQPLGPELMIYDKLQDKVHILNETATQILNLHRKGHSPKEIETMLKSYFSLDEKQNISNDISAALDQIKGLFLMQGNNVGDRSQNKKILTAKDEENTEKDQ